MRPAVGSAAVLLLALGAPLLAGGGRQRRVVNVYSADAAGDLSSVVRGDPALVYVPNSLSNTVDVISQRTLKIVAQFPVGALPQHVTPSYDLRTLYVDNDLGNTLTPIDPRTAKPGRPIPVEDPYNLCFTPDGRFAIVVAERLQRLDFRDPNTMRLVHSLPVPECRGVDHMDFSADGRYGFASCEFAGRMIGALRGSTTTLLARLRMRPGVSPAMLGHGFGTGVFGCGGGCSRVTKSRVGSSRLWLAGRASRARARGDSRAVDCGRRDVVFGWGARRGP